MKEFKIILLHYSCPPVVGGVEEVIAQHAKVFSKYGNTVKILAGAGEKFLDQVAVETSDLLLSRNKKIIDAHNKAIESNSVEPLKDVIEEIYDFLDRKVKNFDVLIAHNVLTMHYNLPLTYALHRIANDKKIPVINWCHDSPFFYDNFPEYLKKKPFHILREYNPNMKYVVISNYRKRMFYNIFGKKGKFHVVPNGIDPFSLLGLSQITNKLIEEQQIFRADLILVQPTRLHPRKNIELSIKVLASLRRKNVDAKLLITGAHDPHEARDAEYKNNLLSLAKSLDVEKHVVFLAGYTFKDGEILTADRIVVRDLLLISDVLFMPSYHEGFGIPLLEAGMLKTPIVCSDIPPFKEIGAGRACFFKLKDSPDKIAEKIISFVSKNKSQKMFRNVIKTYTWDSIYFEKILPLLKNYR